MPQMLFFCLHVCNFSRMTFTEDASVHTDDVRVMRLFHVICIRFHCQPSMRVRLRSVRATSRAVKLGHGHCSILYVLCDGPSGGTIFEVPTTLPEQCSWGSAEIFSPLRDICRRYKSTHNVGIHCPFSMVLDFRISSPIE